MNSFGSDIDKFIGKTERKLQNVARKIAIDCFSEVIRLSPVDTGRFVANWLPSVGSPAGGTVETTDSTRSATIAKAKSVAMTLEAGEVIYLANNLPYAERLETGYSKQAPAGMVRITRARFQPIADAAIKAVASE